MRWVFRLQQEISVGLVLSITAKVHQMDLFYLQSVNLGWQFFFANAFSIKYIRYQVGFYLERKERTALCDYKYVSLALHHLIHDYKRRNTCRCLLLGIERGTLGDGMKQVKISSVQYEILVELGKPWRIKSDDLINELIEENQKGKTK